MMNSFIKRTSVLAVLASAMALTACGKGSNILSSVTFSTYQQNADQYISLTSDINSQDFNFADVTLPITNDGTAIGSVSLSSDVTTGASALVVDLDLSQVLHLPSSHPNQVLPNGTSWPITGVSTTGMVSFPVGTDGSQVYFVQTAANQTLLGVAINVGDLKTGTPVDVFSAFNSNKMTGVAGLYTGSTANTSGFGVLANLSSVMGSQAVATSALPSKASAEDMGKIYEKLLEIRSKHTPITIH